ncbi:hypothetical protein [Halorarum halophilum]|uniref:hypothetical protein n=1 Tax=Halorarum halophilum TaxID=2743090 RepID=UPI001FEC0E46|nr:hypothetical protein [Halobaculum halophilum]
MNEEPTPDAGAGEQGGAEPGDRDDADGGDTFGVGIHVTAEEFRFVVHVPADIDSGWSDPEAFQRRIEEVTWDVLDKEETLRSLSETASAGETVTIGTVSMRPPGTVVSHTLSAPEVRSTENP